jgi:hypothetical protein
MSWCFYVQRVEVRGDCSFSWYWWNIWLSLLNLFFKIYHGKYWSFSYEYHWPWYGSFHTIYVVISTTVCGLSMIGQICAGALLFTTARKHYYMYIWMAYQSLYLEDCVFLPCHVDEPVPTHGRVTRSWVLCVMFKRSLFVLFLLVIVLSILLWFMVSDYPFGIFKLFFWLPGGSLLYYGISG